jgi:hypothetical protein
LGVVEGDSTGDVPGVGDDGVGVEGVAGGPLGGGVAGSGDSSEPVTETSPSPSNCGMSAIAIMSLVGSLGGWRCLLLLLLSYLLQRAYRLLLLQQPWLLLLQLLLGLLLLERLLLLWLQLPHKTLQLLCSCCC